MVNYADTSFLVSLYLPDSHSAKAAALARRLKSAFLFTPLHRVEVRNAIRLAVFRADITASQCSAVLADLDDDVAAGVLRECTLVWTDLFQEAERLSRGFTERLGNRGMDILHVAAALVVGANIFFTFDGRQAALAKNVGLKVRP